MRWQPLPSSGERIMAWTDFFSGRREPARHLSSRRFRPALETLEGRDVPAGVATFDGLGTWTLDPATNAVQLQVSEFDALDVVTNEEGLVVASFENLAGTWL